MMHLIMTGTYNGCVVMWMILATVAAVRGKTDKAMYFLLWAILMKVVTL